MFSLKLGDLYRLIYLEDETFWSKWHPCRLGCGQLLVGLLVKTVWKRQKIENSHF